MKSISNKLKTLLILGCLLSLYTSNLRAQTGGGRAGAFLRNGVSSRALALGRAFTAIADDPSAGYWNPAGLGQIRSTDILGTYSALSLGRKYNYFSCSLPLNSMGTLGLSWINFGIGNIEGRDFQGRITDSFSNFEDAYLLSYGVELMNKLFIGSSLKFINHTLADNQSTGFGYDFGMLYKLTSYINIGMSLIDISTKVKWDTQSGVEEKFPMTSRFGLSINPFKDSRRLSIDFVNIAGQAQQLHAGVELPLTRNIGFRFGIDNNRFVGGAFLTVPLQTIQFETDYSFGRDPVDLIFAHRVTFRLQFNKLGFDLNSSHKFNLDETDGTWEVFFSNFKARIIKISGDYPNYALINAGSQNGIREGMLLNVFRNNMIPGQDGRQKLLLGEVRVMRVKDKLAAVAVKWMKEGFLLSVGDYLFVEENDFSVNVRNN